MTEQDNSVNMENAAGRRGFLSSWRFACRGDDRGGAGKRLRDGDGTDLGLRALARGDQGPSATARHRHFPDKEALLDALADEGLRRLGARSSRRRG